MGVILMNYANTWNPYNPQFIISLQAKLSRIDVRAYQIRNIPRFRQAIVVITACGAFTLLDY